jgi:glycosyltransferase involved in cell wall biosynthesis
VDDSRLGRREFEAVMHILLIHQAYTAIDEPGGTRHDEFARSLAARGHRVTVITGTRSYMLDAPAGSDRGAGRKMDGNGVEIIRCRTYESWHRSFFRRLLSFFSFMASAAWTGLQVRQVDVVWGTSPPMFQAVSAWAVARLKGAGFLLEVRDLWPEFAVATGVLRQPVLIGLSRWLEGFLYRRADQLVVNSPGFVEAVKRAGGQDVRVVPNGADPEMFNPGDRGAPFRAEHGLAGKFVVLYAGAHGLSNDLDLVLGAAHALSAEENVAFVLVGDGKEKPRLMKQAAADGLSSVVFLPPLPKQEIGHALAAADACLAVLKPIEAYKTTFPNKVFDYMAAGRPVLLAIDGVIRQVVETAGAGLFVPPGDSAALADAVRKLMSSPGLGGAMGKRGRQAVESTFNRADLVIQMEQALEWAAGSRAS